MKVLLVNGSPHEKGCTYVALTQVRQALEENGIETELFHVGTKPIAQCIACGKCHTSSGCIFDDCVSAVAARLDTFDGFVVGAPVYYAGPSAQSLAFLDRLFYSAAEKLRGKPAAAVVSCRRGGASAAYDRLHKYFGINSMPIVTSSYWNQIPGTTPQEALQDEEGLDTMRQLGENMAWLLRCIAAGKASGIERREIRPKRRTNFIR